MERDNQPTFNVNRKVVNFKDFASNKEQLEKDAKAITPNSDRQQLIDNTKKEYDPMTKKLTDFSKDEIEDKLKSIEEYETANEELLGLQKPDISKKVVEFKKLLGELLIGGYPEEKIEKIVKDMIK